ncbi:MAG TPA: PLP-dependent aminotransferase family protein [Gemmatimonadaceae bacterium]
MSHENIAFDSGHAFAGVLPDLITEAADALSLGHRLQTLQYAPRAGLPELREWIAGYMRADGASVTSEEILITNGAKHALELVCRLVVDEGDAVVVTAPTYFSAIPILCSFGVEFIEAPQDHLGLHVDALAEILDQRARDRKPRPKFIYNVPDFHNPTGVTMPLERRTALLDLARRYDVLVVEDSPYRKVRFEGESVPSLKSLDSDGHVLLLGTFSKLVAPGLRIGWVAATASIVARMAQLKTDAGSCPLTQRIILEFCSAAGRLDEHTARVQAAYRSNRDRMMAAVARELPDVTYPRPAGGYYLWLTLPSGVDGDDFARAASEAGVTVIAGSRCFARGDGGHPRNHVRLAFSHATHDQIDDGMARLARALSSLVGRTLATQNG